jgi:putative ABC transport system permease protein
MIRPRWRKVLSDLWENKMRTLLVVASIAVGVFSIGMIAGTYEIISTDMGASYASANPANIDMRTENFDQPLLDSLQNLEGVKEVEGRYFFSVRARHAGGEWNNLDLVAIKDFTDTHINLLLPLEGDSIPENKEVILESEALIDLDVNVGDELEFQLPDGRVKAMIMAGIVQDQTTGAGDFLAPPLGYVTADTLPWLGQPNGYNRLLSTVTGDSNDLDHIREVSATLSDKIEKSNRQIYRTDLNQTNEHPTST